MIRRLLFTALLSSMVVGAFAQIESVGIIGSATPNGWDSDTNMVQDETDTAIWTLDLFLTDGEAKFRANDDWAINWGDTSWPVGTGFQEGPNIPVSEGNYQITFNSVTGDYSFGNETDIGIIGDATPGGWDEDTDMFQNPEDTNKYFLKIDLKMGELKFRQDNDWVVNWGATDFPSGTATQDGPNIPIPFDGKYQIDFDKSTGEYNFEEVVDIISVGIIGDATAGGWDSDTDLQKVSADEWSATLELTDGEAKFRANDDWAINWGDTTWPSGIGILGGPNIPVTAGVYIVSINTSTGAYNFQEVVNYATVGIIGDATPGGWDADTDMERDDSDSAVWKLRIELADGEAKFRADDDWAVNWGAGDFPSGTATRDGANIPITAGEYNITFNTTTGDYDFVEIFVYDTVGLIGTATPFGDWDNDVDMTKTEENENVWVIESVDLVDGEAKFRVDHDWAINWGAAEFPAGTGTQDGPNILITGGTYKVTLNSATGEYSFDPPTSVQDLLDDSAIALFPNPTNDVLNINMDVAELTGKIRLAVIDMNGRLMLYDTQLSTSQMSMDVSTLPAGNYFLQISNDKYIIGKRFVKFD
jgi:type IX secretion system substrate protein/SusE-like outer membrane protein